jgi:transposase-like protein
MSIRQLDAELAVSYKTIYRRVQRFQRSLDAPRLQFEGPVGIDELYVSAVKKGRERDQEPRSRGLSTRGRGKCQEDKPPVFILADRGTGETYVHPAKTVEESTIRVLLADRQQESLTVYTDGFRAYEPLAEDDAFDRKYVVHSEGEYADEDGTSTLVRATRPWRNGGSLRIEVSPKTNSHPTSENSNFGSVLAANPATKNSKSSSKLLYDVTNNPLPMSVTYKRYSIIVILYESC